MVDMNWWKQAKGQMTSNQQDFFDKVDAAPKETLFIVDFFMPQCHYCVEFMPSWNKIVDEFKAEYGDKIQFLKVDGVADRYTADQYRISSFPSFIALEPGTFGD